MKKLQREIKIGEEFGMYLERKGESGWTEPNNSGEWGLIKPDGKYEIALPHSCDQWSIAYGKKEECIKELGVFIAEAKAVLEALEEEPDDPRVGF